MGTELYLSYTLTKSLFFVPSVLCMYILCYAHTEVNCSIKSGNLSPSRHCIRANLVTPTKYSEWTPKIRAGSPQTRVPLRNGPVVGEMVQSKLDTVPIWSILVPAVFPPCSSWDTRTPQRNRANRFRGFDSGTPESSPYPIISLDYFPFPLRTAVERLGCEKENVIFHRLPSRIGVFFLFFSSPSSRIVRKSALSSSGMDTLHTH